MALRDQASCLKDVGDDVHRDHQNVAEEKGASEPVVVQAKLFPAGFGFFLCSLEFEQISCLQQTVKDSIK